ncbi:glycosyltransferase family 25 protein [Nemania sp. FL0916]|nr:glycosyltransferase family 25 protein [Nemania sp. FL0916]
MFLQLLPVPARSRKSRLLFLAAAAALAIVFLVAAFRALPEFPYTFRPKPVGKESLGDQAGNATLGFQKILALSTHPSWRTRGLQTAANLSGLAIDIPTQPRTPEAFVEAFRSIGANDPNIRTPDLGSSRAWLAHLDLLKYVVAAGYETALIVEDDVDWDVRVKEQMRLISSTVRRFVRAEEAGERKVKTQEDGDGEKRDTEKRGEGKERGERKGVGGESERPFTTTWDILWLGHCGATFSPSSDPHLSFIDSTVCPPEQYTGWWAPSLRLTIPPAQRVLQRAGRTTVCTFAYAVTFRGAQNILSLLGSGGGEAFDVQLSTRCRDRELDCLLVNPQVFQHYEPPVNMGASSLIRLANGLVEGVDEGVFEGEMGGTGNIERSARCEALFGRRCLRRFWGDEEGEE